MPKNRRRNNQKGAKSLSVRTKFKVGGRKSSRGVKQMSNNDLIEGLKTARPRDRFTFLREMNYRVALLAA